MGSLRKHSSLLFWICIVRIGFAQPVDKEEAVSIGGIKQWISIKGLDLKNPVLLHLHGGPGNSVMSYADKFTSDLQKDFVVVQWDQRESGKTARLNPSDKPITVDLMMSDAEEMVRYLRTRFSKERIYLSGHSWGGFLALLVASRHPELFEACISMAPMDLSRSMALYKFPPPDISRVKLLTFNLPLPRSNRARIRLSNRS